jgi:hypothetical protein
MKHNGSLPSARIFVLAAMGFWASCGGDSSGPKDSGSEGCSTPGTSTPTPACGNPGITAAVCTTQAPASAVTDISGTWVLETIGAQVVQASGFKQPFHIKSISTALVQVTQTGNAVSFDGQYCDRIQNDDPQNPAKVQVLPAWQLTPSPLHRVGTYASDVTGQLTLSMPAVVETFGAQLADPACEMLPLEANDPRLVDHDNDGYPGISVGLQGLVTGTLRSVQRQVTALTGYALTADRIEGGMFFNSDQTVVASEPANIQCLYRMSQSFTDPTECSSTFVMVKVNASAGAVDCAWVRENQKALLGL